MQSAHETDTVFDEMSWYASPGFIVAVTHVRNCAWLVITACLCNLTGTPKGSRMATPGLYRS